MRLGNERVDSKLFAIGLVSSRQWTGYQKDGVKVAGMPLVLLYLACSNPTLHAAPLRCGLGFDYRTLVVQ